MPWLNIFQKKKQEASKPEKPKIEKKPKVQKEAKNEKAQKQWVKAAQPTQRPKSRALAFGVLEQAHITEKAGIQSEKGKYIFRISPTATKPEVKKAVEGFYNVNVVKVNIINIHRKRKQLMRTRGFKQGHRKAIVSLQKGQAIELLPR